MRPEQFESGSTLSAAYQRLDYSSLGCCHDNMLNSVIPRAIRFALTGVVLVRNTGRDDIVGDPYYTYIEARAAMTWLWAASQ